MVQINELHDEVLDPLLLGYCEEGITQAKMVTCLHDDHNIQTTLQTLQRILQCFDLTTACASMTQEQKELAYPLVQQYYTLRMTCLEAMCAIKDTYDIPINMYNIQTMSKDLGINWCCDHVQQGRVTVDQVVDLLLEAIEGEDWNAGYRTMQQNLATNHHIRINCDTASLPA